MKLELMDAVGSRLVERGQVRVLQPGDCTAIEPDRLFVHQGCGRATPPGVRDAARRLELDDATVTWGVGSGHCQIWLEAGAVFVRDSGSDNGTFVDRERVTTQVAAGASAELRGGDVLRVGRVALRVTGAPSGSGGA